MEIAKFLFNGNSHFDHPSLERRGWGMRCLDDLPKGCFICVYTGLLLSEDEANEERLVSQIYPHRQPFLTPNHHAL